MNPFLHRTLNRILLCSSLGLCLSLLQAGIAQAETHRSATPTPVSQASSSQTRSTTRGNVLQAATLRQGLPGRRSAAATRSDSGPGELVVLAPTQTPWLVLSERPSLLVYLGQASPEAAISRTIELLVEDSAGQLVYEKFFQVPDRSGIFQLELNSPLSGQSLRMNEDYTWQLSVISSAVDRSSDRYEWGTLRRIDAPLTTGNPLQRAQQYQELGLWQAAAQTLYTELQDSSSTVPSGQIQQAWAALLQSLDLSELQSQPLAQGELLKQATIHPSKTSQSY